MSDFNISHITCTINCMNNWQRTYFINPFNVFHYFLFSVNVIMIEMCKAHNSSNSYMPYRNAHNVTFGQYVYFFSLTLVMIFKSWRGFKKSSLPKKSKRFFFFFFLLLFLFYCFKSKSALPNIQPVQKVKTVWTGWIFGKTLFWSKIKLRIWKIIHFKMTFQKNINDIFWNETSNFFF